MRRLRPTVVKLGGSLLEDAARRAAVVSAVAQAWNAGEAVVVVHGGGKRLDAHLASLGIPRRVHDGLRITDGPTLEAAVGVLAGVVNKSIVAEFREAGIPAAGICGADGATLVAEKRPSFRGRGPRLRRRRGSGERRTPERDPLGRHAAGARSDRGRPRRGPVEPERRRSGGRRGGGSVAPAVSSSSPMSRVCGTSRGGPSRSSRSGTRSLCSAAPRSRGECGRSCSRASRRFEREFARS